MATYNELFNLMGDTVLRNRIAVSCIVAAESIRTESPATTDHDKRLVWVENVFC